MAPAFFVCVSNQSLRIFIAGEKSTFRCFRANWEVGSLQRTPRSVTHIKRLVEWLPPQFKKERGNTHQPFLAQPTIRTTPSPLHLATPYFSILGHLIQPHPTNHLLSRPLLHLLLTLTLHHRRPFSRSTPVVSVHSLRHIRYFSVYP